MRLTRVHVAAPLAAGARLVLPADAAAHVARVLRLRAGAALTLFDGTGGEYAARIEDLERGRVTVSVGAHDPAERESPLAVTLAQGIARGERMDLVVQKATELGVAAIAPVFAGRSVVRLDERQAARRREHWQAIAVGACEQCGRNRIPAVHAPVALEEFLRAGAGTSGDGVSLRLLLSPGAAQRIGDLPRPQGGVTVLIGPEGGLTDAEQELAARHGYTAVRLGPRVLRTETAALAALTLLQREFGDLTAGG